jgi:hypothetical protein
MVLEGEEIVKGNGSTLPYPKHESMTIVMRKALETPRVQSELRNERNLSS